MNLLIPVSGSSLRYPNVRPKFLLCHPLHNYMIVESLRGLNLKAFDNIIIIGLKEHEKKYKCFQGIKEELILNYGKNFNVLITLLNKRTKNQAETVYRGLQLHKNLKGGIFIKDCDNYFELTDFSGNYNFVATGDLNNLGKVNASNKSYVNIGKDNTIVNIIEKKVIGNKFCCGGYYFANVEEYKKYYLQLRHHNDLYISHIIYNMILDGHLFFNEESKNYIDWGTMEDWTTYTKTFGTIFLDLDGTVVKSSGRWIKPTWGNTKALKKNVEYINKLYDTNRFHIIIATARTEASREITIEQLKKFGVKYHRLIMDLPHAKRILINDYSDTNPFPVSIAVNLQRNSDELERLF